MRALYLLALIVISVLATIANAQGACTAATVDKCFDAIRSGSNCVYESGKCMYDPCLTLYTEEECHLDRRCLYTPWMPAACNNRNFLCSSITSPDSCKANPLCSVSGKNCMYSVPTSYQTALPKESECPGFPVWAIALVVVWILMIVVFAIIIMLVRKKPARNQFEQSNISVEGVGNKDNFTTELDEPFH